MKNDFEAEIYDLTLNDPFRPGGFEIIEKEKIEEIVTCARENGNSFWNFMISKLWVEY